VHEAENDGADAVLVLPPYFSVYPDKNIEAYFRRICSESDIPVFIYNFPALTGFSFDVGLVRRLLTDCPNLIGIKDTTDDTEHLRAMISLKKEFPRFVVYSAYEKQAWQMMNEGVDGFVNATANFAPDISSIFFREFSKDNLIMARDYYEMMIKASKIYDCSEPLYLAVKEAVYQRVLGHRGTERLPALSLNVERREEIGEILRELSKMQEPYSMQVQKGI
jgi:4-hydroxy-tetrahydrodipicolinate synthase